MALSIGTGGKAATVLLGALSLSVGWGREARAADEAGFAAAAQNGVRSEEVFRRTRRMMQAWLAHADERTLLLPDVLPGFKRGPKPLGVYRPHNSGADNYPYLVATAFFTDRPLYEGRLREMLRNEVRYTNVVDGIPGDLDLPSGQLGPKSLFGAAEYAKDGLLAITELLGRTPWFYRMADMTAAVMEHGPVESRFGRLPDVGAELNGDVLQVLVRLATMTGDRRFLEWAERLGDAYVLEVLPGNHGLPGYTWDFTAHTGPDRMRLRDHGNEIVVGLSLLHALEADLGRPRGQSYRAPIATMLDRILASANPDGLLYDDIRASDLQATQTTLSDNWGYVYGAVYTHFMATGDERYREAVRKVLRIVMADSSTTPVVERAPKKGLRRLSTGLQVAPVFCPAEVADPFDTVTWEVRTAAIKGENGEVLFEQTNCEVPTFWTQLATNVVCSKYFYGEVNTPQREYSVRQLIHRVTRTIADWGIKDGYFATAEDGERFYRELSWLCLHQHGAFNSPVWFNVGLFHQYGVKGAACNWHWDPETDTVRVPENPYEFPQGSACFIQSVEDNMEDIMELARSEAMLFKFGSGTGTDLSTLRSEREKLSGGGKPSGPLSFMRVYDQIAAVVKSGGKTRRAAKMQSLKVWHPDILDFIECKAKEEKKARTLIAAGYDSNFNGEAYSSVMFQNANLSVRVTDEFMQACEQDKPWATRWVTDPTVAGPVHQARDLMNRMAANAWQCGDPGVQYDTTINTWHTCPNSGRINASNPCSEYMFLDNTACNLASINLMKCRQADGTFDVERFRNACRLFFIAQEILIDHASYPTKRIAANSHKFRPLGLGYSNIGSLLMSSGLPYDSDEGRGVCGAITALLHGSANLTSAELAAAVGPFDGFAENREPMLNVMRMHREAADKIDPACPAYMKEAACELWDEVVSAGRVHGYRNAQATVLAPTGTISFLMDCDTTGIEPDIALVKYKQLAGGGMLKIVNNTVPAALKKLGYDQPSIEGILSYIDKNDTIEGAPNLKAEHLPVFDCAFTPRNGTRSIQWHAHVSMMAAAQPFLSGAISKTVSMPRESTPEDIAKAYTEGWKLGLKALAIYRDGSKESQPLNTSSEEGKAADKAKVAAGPRRRRLPDTRHSLTHKFSVGGHEGYLTVGLYEDGKPGEVFITMAKEGSTVGGLMDSLGTAISMGLQYGVPLEAYVNKFSHMRFEPMGYTKNPDIKIAKSVVDYIVRFLGVTFLEGYREATVDKPPTKSSDSEGDDASGQSTPTAKKAGGLTANGSATKAGTPSGNGTNGSHTNGTNGHGKSTKADSVKTDAAKIEAKAKADDLLLRAGVAPKFDLKVLNAGGSLTNRSEQFAGFQSDAPSCDNCGSICVRAGNCYLCHNCGASQGCS